MLVVIFKVSEVVVVVVLFVFSCYNYDFFTRRAEVSLLYVWRLRSRLLG